MAMSDEPVSPPLTLETLDANLVKTINLMREQLTQQSAMNVNILNILSETIRIVGASAVIIKRSVEGSHDPGLISLVRMMDEAEERLFKRIEELPSDES